MSAQHARFITTHYIRQERGTVPVQIDHDAWKVDKVIVQIPVVAEYWVEEIIVRQNDKECEDTEREETEKEGENHSSCE